MCSCQIIVELETGTRIRIDPRDLPDLQIDSEPKEELACSELEPCEV